MKIVLLFLCIHLGVLGQSERQSQERPGLFWYYSGLRPFKDIDRKKYDRVIIDLTYNDWIGENGPFQNNLNSIGFSVSINKDVQFKSTERVAFGIGLGYAYLNHRTPRVFYLTPFDAVQAAIPSPTDSILSSFLTIHQFYVPLELRLRSIGWKHVKLILGARVGVQPRMNFSSYRQFEEEVSYSEVKLREEYNWFYLSTYARLGFRNWSLFFAYQPLTLFSNNESLDIHPIQMGISLSLF
tara:strand:- start:11326 stop:12045 length:720 start_codon:yes stop_codon:yes gene_type:complete